MVCKSMHPLHLILIIMIFSIASGCEPVSQAQQVDQSTRTEHTATRGTRPIIEVVTVSRTIHQETINATGTVAAKQTSRIGPMVEGIIEKIFVRVGDRPRKGDPLFQVRTVEYEQLVDQARAALSVAYADQELRMKRLQRARQLATRNLLSIDELDLTTAAAKVAQANAEGARSSLAAAEQHLKDTLVLAPFNGTVTGRFADEGVYMSNRFSMGDQSSVIELSEAEIVAGIMRVPEALLRKLKLGQRALVYPGGSIEPVESEVIIINDRVDSNTRTAEFRLPIKNDDYLIKPGQFIRAEVMTEPMEIFQLPNEAVFEKNGESHVALLGIAGFKPHVVRTQRVSDRIIQVLEGLQEHQQVALNPKLALETPALADLVISYVDR